MTTLRHRFGSRPALLLALALAPAWLAGCGGSNLDPILGSPAVAAAPTVIATSPVAGTPVVTGVAGTAVVTARFSQPMAPATLTPASFTLACPQGTPAAASVAYDAATRTATLTPSVALPPDTLCEATVGTAVQDSLGIALQSPFVWAFMTAPLADTTRPTVVLTVPGDGATDVAVNSRITATFSEAMDPATLDATSFTLMDTTLGMAVAGSVTYAATGRSATFTPTAGPLTASNGYTATLTSAVTDLAGNALAGNTAVAPAAGAHVWSFTAGGSADGVAPTVTAVSPADGASDVCPNAAVSASFSEPMDPDTVDGMRFVVTDNGVPVAGSVRYDAPGRIASFVPTAASGLAAGTTFVATVRSGVDGVKDLAGQALASDRVWTFATGSQACLTAVDLGTIASFGAFGGAAGVTNQGIFTRVDGNLGSTAACTLITGLHDAANVYTETPLNVGAVNGSIYCAPPAPGTTTTMTIATRARADAQAAYDALAALPPGGDPGAGELGGLVLNAGVYTAAGGSFDLTTGDLTLDAQGDSAAVWVFQMASALTVGQPAMPRQVRLVNGAQARNVFWQVGSAARIEDGSTMVGTLIAPAGVTISTAGQTVQTTLIGRAIGLTASVTMVNTTVVAP